jgi:eukaryotic-like serine/threonine-protein kinase
MGPPECRDGRMGTWTLGDFELDCPIGRGGMGEVWRGQHVGHGRPVAAKFIRPDRVSEEQLLAFRREVLSAARLNHAHVIRVYDQGVVGPGGAVPAGTPFLVMELAEGSLADRPPQSWSQARALLRATLAGLAHAHAHDVLHLDIKPQNLLWSERRLKLADFGIARLRTGLSPLGTESAGQSAGSPASMAPEQFRRGEPLLPQTDLYAVGCLATQWVCGRPPFEVHTLVQARRAHLDLPPPPLAPLFAVPDALEGWIDALLRKRPSERFEHAADAMHALLHLGRERSRASLTPPTPTPALDASTMVEPAQQPPPHAPDPGHRLEPARAVRPPPAPFPPSVPRRVDDPQSRFRDAGLGLFGLCPLPLIGRESWTARLWARLSMVHRTGTSRIVVLQGAGGVGKSALAHWLAVTAREAGAAETLRATHAELPGAHNGIGPMVLRFLDAPAPGDVGATLRARLGEHLDPAVLDPLAETLARPDRPHDLRVLGDRVEALLRAVSHARPTIVWLEDCQWAAPTLRWVAATGTSKPVLWLLTVDDEARAERPTEADLLERLCSRPDTERWSVPPLDLQATRALVHALLGMRGPAAATIVERCGGSPVFAVAAAGELVSRGALVTQPPVVSSHLAQTWGRRLDALPLSRQERDALEVAAALGIEVDGGAWRAALAVPVGLVDRLVAAGLALPSRGGWRFCHGMFRDAVLNRAEQAGRLPDHHRRCVPVASSPLDRGRHWLSAGEPGRAATFLLQGIEDLITTGQSDLAAALLDQLASACSASDHPPEDPMWGDLRLLRTRTTRGADAMHGLEVVDAVLQDAQRHGWSEVRPRALARRAILLRLRGETRAAARAYPLAYRAAVAAEEPRLAAAVAQGMGWLSLNRGESTEAERWFTLVEEEAHARNDVHAAMIGRYGIGMARLHAGEVDQAIALFEGCRDQVAQAGLRCSLGDILNALGEATRMAGRLDEAEAHYQACIQATVHGGTMGDLTPRMNLGLVHLAQGQHTLAAAELGACRRRFASNDRRAFAAVCAVFEAVAAAHAGDWGPWDAQLEQAADTLAATGFIDPDVAVVATEGASLIGEHASRSGPIRRLAVQQATALGRADLLERLQNLA